MKKLTLFLVLLGTTAVLAKDVEFEPFMPSLGRIARGSVTGTSDAPTGPTRLGPKRPVAKLAKRTPAARYLLVARTIRTDDARLFHVFEETSAPIRTNAFANAFYGVESEKVLTCREIGY